VILGVYKDPTEDRTFYSPDREPTVNLPFPLWHITGLDNNSKPHPLYMKKSDYAKALGIDPRKVHSNTTGSGPSGSFLGSDMRAAYYQGTALTGSGQNIALFELAGTDLVDLSTLGKQNRTLPLLFPRAVTLRPASMATGAAARVTIRSRPST
jgi:hypothetical protein